LSTVKGIIGFNFLNYIACSGQLSVIVKTKIILIYIILTSSSILCQEIDSVKVILSDSGNGGEKYRLLYRGEKIFEISSTARSHRYRSFKIKGEDNWDRYSYLPISMEIKGRFGVFYRKTIFNVDYVLGNKYLIIYRDNRFKKRYSFDYYWSNDDFRWRIY